ncbi:MAG TPA: MAPEG family protein [Candidatus Saccharimonadia bacterium]|nr:MAPEG family protein [Candidatus Saccharimonadia bacterium]
MVLHLPALVAALTVVLLAVLSWNVGRARDRYGVKAPATSGPPEFERAFRVQMNTLEGALMFLPSLWLFGHYVNPLWAGILGFIWLVARAWYAVAYGAARNRSIPFGLAGAVTGVLLFGSLFFIVRAMLLQS